MNPRFPGQPALSDELFRDTLGHLLVALGVLMLAAAAVLVILDLPPRYAAHAVMAFAVMSAAILTQLPHHRPRRRFGPANRVTLLRGVLIILIGSVVGLSLSDSQLPYWLAGAAFVALLLDGADGWLARRSGMASPFGARFDMELDALFILTLAILLWQMGKVEMWVLLCGLWRYAFVAAAWIWPWLNGSLADSARRKVVCVTQVLVLIAALTPWASPRIATALVAAGLALLSYSFVVDILALHRQARSAPPIR